MNENKSVLVSGCNGGIGKAICLSLLSEGYKVYGIDIAKKGEIEDPSFTYIQCDITDKNALTKKLSIIKENLFGVISAAGIFLMESIIEGDEEDLRKIMEVNFFGTYYLINSIFHKLEKGSRIIILTSEVARYSPQPFMGYYTISKHSVDCYADVLRRECAYLGIHVSKIQSGAISTGLLKGVDAKYDRIINETKYFKEPLTKFKGLMLGETKKHNSPTIIGKLALKILKAKKPKGRYRIKNSLALRMLNSVPESMQDSIYKKVIR